MNEAQQIKRSIDRIHDKIEDLSSLIGDLDWDFSELAAAKEDMDIGDDEPLSFGEWNFSKRDAGTAFDMLDEIGLNPRRRYSLIQMQEIRLAVERILR